MKKLTIKNNNKIELNYFCTEQDALNRLAEYEDLGFTPTEIKLLVKEYSEEYKLGDTLYIVPSNYSTITEPLTAVIRGISMESNMLILKVFCFETNDIHYINAKNIGRIAFTNKDEAMEYMKSKEE